MALPPRYRHPLRASSAEQNKTPAKTPWPQSPEQRLRGRRRCGAVFSVAPMEGPEPSLPRVPHVLLPPQPRAGPDVRSGDHSSRARAPGHWAAAIHLRVVGCCRSCASVSWIEREVDGMASGEYGALDCVGGYERY